MEIRKAELSDIPELTTLGEKLIRYHEKLDRDYYQIKQEFHRYYETFLKEQLVNQHVYFLIAEENNRIIGFNISYLKPLFSWFVISTVGHISFIYVDDNFRGKKVGKKLIEQTVSWFREKGVKYIETFVDENNFPGKNAWKSYGFKEFKKYLRFDF
ncbi:MAG: GCN5-related N-acetyltransferase [Candidatus Gottesmanbacteria bacterium GW2011_GWA2_41_12]|uniref:GCN5-related N-acetyltransferase n=2 Tax=Candidatus Gottesmaniibacteriota TaxID=1752720 RepID=A0A0G0UM64_9BACT|nr:MAG: GCN5-related N-acetyltransferase [Candidatus Gottesmanbacteria bacterium GW2011_GWC2_39_8]KKR88606.1 MAG: GCN5-related N-acetyltransferase [Candidatus Gottesmanbacteria bacterium GW2011_GWA2_41_12]